MSIPRRGHGGAPRRASEGGATIASLPASTAARSCNSCTRAAYCSFYARTRSACGPGGLMFSSPNKRSLATLHGACSHLSGLISCRCRRRRATACGRCFTSCTCSGSAKPSTPANMGALVPLAVPLARRAVACLPLHGIRSWALQPTLPGGSVQSAVPSCVHPDCC